MTQGPFKLSDDEFWTDPYKAEDELIHDLADQDFEGLVLDAPEVVNLGKRSSLPAMILVGESLRDQQRFPEFRDAALLVGIHQERNVCLVARARRENNPPAGIRRKPDEDPGDGASYRTVRVDARTRLRIPWRAASWQLYLLRRDALAKAPHPVRLEPPGQSFEDPAVAAFLAAHEKVGYPRAVRPPAAPEVKPGAKHPQQVPWYRELPGSPPIPDAPGIALAIERVQVIEDGFGGAVLHGSYRLPVLPREVVRPCEETDEELARMVARKRSHEWGDDPEDDPTAEEEEHPDGYLTDDEVEWPPEEEEEEHAGEPVLEPWSSEWPFDDPADPPEKEPQELPWEAGFVWEDVGDADATCVIPFTVVTSGALLAEPFILHLQVPSYGPVQGDAPEATGHFAIDLLAFGDSYVMRRQTSWIYAFSGAHVAGPVPVALLGPEALGS